MSDLPEARPIEPGPVLEYAHLAHYHENDGPPTGCPMTMELHPDGRGITIAEPSLLRDNLGDIVGLTVLTGALFAAAITRSREEETYQWAAWIICALWLPVAVWGTIKIFKAARRPRTYVVREGELVISRTRLGRRSRWPRDYHPKLEVKAVLTVGLERFGTLYIARSGSGYFGLWQRVLPPRPLAHITWLANTLNAAIERTGKQSEGVPAGSAAPITSGTTSSKPTFYNCFR